MRIVYDDTKQSEFVKLYTDYVENIMDTKDLTAQSYGMDRISSHKFYSQLNDYLKRNNFEIGQTVTHAHGIGNNCQYPVYWTGNSEEMQQVAYINIIHGMFGEMYTSVDDFNQNLITDSSPYEVLKWGLKSKGELIKRYE